MPDCLNRCGRKTREFGICRWCQMKAKMNDIRVRQEGYQSDKKHQKDKTDRATTTKGGEHK